MFKKVLHYISSFKEPIGLIVWLVIFYYFILNSNISYENKDMTLGENKFHINSHYHINNQGLKVVPDKTFIILKYGPLGKRGGILRYFFQQQHKSNNNVHTISIMNDQRIIDKNLIDNIHSIITSTLGIEKYILVFTNIGTEIIKEYTDKYKTEVEDVIQIKGMSQFLYYDVKNGTSIPLPREHKIYFGEEYFYVYDFMPMSDTIQKTFIILPGYSYFDATTYINEQKYILYAPNKDFRALICELVKSNNRVVVVEYFGYNNSGETTRERHSDNICEEIHKVIEELKIKKYILLPHSISGLYALDYVKKYSNEVEGIVCIDITLPFYFLEEYNSNVQYLQSKFNDGGKKTSESFKNMHSYFWETAKKLEGYKLDEDLPIIFFVSIATIKHIDEQINNGVLKTKIIDYINDMVTNTQHQHICILEGTHYLHHSQSDVIVKKIKEEFNIL